MLKKIYNYMITLSIRRKFFIGYLLAAILPMCVITFYSYSNTRNNLTDQNYFNMENNLTQTNSNIEKKLETYSKSSALFYLNNTLKNYLDLDYTKYSMVDAYYYIDNYFKNTLILNPDISLATVFIYNKTLPADKYFIKHIDDSLQNENWYRSLKDSTGNVIFSGTYKNSEGKYVFTLARYLNDGNISYPYGILALTIDEEQLYSLIEKSSNDTFNFIVDKDGNIISCKDKALISKSVYALLNIDKSVLSDSDKIDVTYNGKKMLMVYRTMGNGWKTITMVSYNSFLGNIKKAASFIFVIFLFSLSLAIVLIYTLSGVLTKRINKMVKQVKKLQLGNFNYELLNMGSDEIGNLSDAFNVMSKKLKFLIEEVYQKELLKKQAEMNVLQEQINPHFLYNALASISSLALRNNDKKVNEMSSLLGKFYRLSLNKGKNMFLISSEIELTKYYMEIQKIRFLNLLNITFDLDETLMQYRIPKLILQPFIENSINHGIWDDERAINIIIRLYKIDASIIFEVVDDGIGMNNKTLESLLKDMATQKEGFGIKNVNNRIKLYFGEDYGVKIFSKLGIGTQVKITLPIKTE